MISNIELDVVCHLGYIKNISLLSRGAYYIQATLLHGGNDITTATTKVAPIGSFSAPTTIDSYVGNQKIPISTVFNVSHIDDEEMIFRSRVFYIRYRRETHELNDGVHWRIRIPQVDLVNTSTPICNELLVIRFELVCSELDVNENHGIDLNKWIPDDNTYSIVATQNIVIQRAASGFHEYHPIRFDRFHFIDLDCMIHCGISSITYPSIHIDNNYYDDIYEKFWEKYSIPVIVNYDKMMLGSNFIFNIYMQVKGKDESLRIKNETDNIQRCILNYKDDIVNEMKNCKGTKNDIIQILKNKIDISNSKSVSYWSLIMSSLPRIMPAISKLMREYYKEKIRLFWKQQMLVHTCAEQFLSRPHPKEDIMSNILYSDIVREFKSSSLGISSTSSSQLYARGMPCFDGFYLKMDRLPNIVLRQYSKVNIGARSSLSEKAIRGGILMGTEYDIVLAESLGEHVDISMLNRTITDLVIEEEVADVSGVNVIVEDSPPDFTSSHPKFAKPDPKLVHLIVLQHGFQGNSWDMRLLQSYISVEMPEHVDVLVATSNEVDSEKSIIESAEALAKEIVDYCNDEYPSLMSPAEGGRISFFGHSLGGVIIRKALEDPIMMPLVPKMHAYVSLASPHLGTLHSQSMLISVGMRAFYQIKKAPALKELFMEDGIDGKIEKSIMYRLSKNGVLKYFKHVIFISSPKDQYVPTYSARVQSCERAENNSKTGSYIKQMLTNIIAQVDANRLIRISLDNNCGETTNVNTLIGRTAHLCYLENSIAVEQLIHSLYPYLI